MLYLLLARNRPLRANKITLLAHFVKISAIFWRDNRVSRQTIIPDPARQGFRSGRPIAVRVPDYKFVIANILANQNAMRCRRTPPIFK
jgi:hypothetical protein